MIIMVFTLFNLWINTFSYDKFIFIIDEWDAILRECGHMKYDEELTVTVIKKTEETKEAEAAASGEVQ